MNRQKLASLIIPSLTVFISSACIMIIELVASRLIARHLGSSLYTWTSVIGVVLAGITVGNYLGGRIADKYIPRKILSALFCFASIACVSIIILNNLIGGWLWLWQLSWPIRVFLHVSIVFLVPSTLLGTISPVVAKMALDQGLPTGRTVGDIYACGAAGSIAGTFLAGFYLIGTLGTIAIIWTIALTLLCIALAYQIKAWFLYIWAMALILLFFFGVSGVSFAQDWGSTIGLREKEDPMILYQDETPYCWVAIRQISTNPDRRIFLQDKLKHSEILMDDITALQYFYTKIFAGLTSYFVKDIQPPSFLVIGGGGYVFPQYLLATYPKARVDVAEIDPGVTEAAYAAFGLPHDTSICSINLDARNYVDDILLRKKKGQEIVRYDVIYEDAINDYCVPFQLVTLEFNEKVKEILSDDGLYLINLIDTYENARFLGSLTLTLQKSFPYVHILTTKMTFAELRETFVVAASMKPFDPKQILREYDPLMKVKTYEGADYDYIIQKANGVILVDDYAPVEILLAPVIRQSAKELLAAEYLRLAKDYKNKHQFDQSISYYKLAADNNPSMTIFAYNEIALIYVTLNNFSEAIAAFQKAIDYYYTNEGNQPIIGSLHMNLGILYGKLNDFVNSAKHLNLAIVRFQEEIDDNPKNAEALSRLGDTYATLGRFREASECFKKAHELIPNNSYYLGNLIRSLEFQGLYSEAINYIDKMIFLLQEQQNLQGLREMESYRQQIFKRIQ